MFTVFLQFAQLNCQEMRTRTSLLRDILDILDILACHIYSFTSRLFMLFSVELAWQTSVNALYKKHKLHGNEWKPFCCVVHVLLQNCVFVESFSCSLIVRKRQEFEHDFVSCIFLCFDLFKCFSIPANHIIIVYQPQPLETQTTSISPASQIAFDKGTSISCTHLVVPSSAVAFYLLLDLVCFQRVNVDVCNQKKTTENPKSTKSITENYKKVTIKILFLL